MHIDGFISALTPATSCAGSPSSDKSLMALKNIEKSARDKGLPTVPTVYGCFSLVTVLIVDK